jgi:hypothetical protein
MGDKAKPPGQQQLAALLSLRAAILRRPSFREKAGALWPAISGPIKPDMMTNDSRIDVRIPAQRRRELELLAEDAGLSLGGLVRLAARRLLEDRELLLKSRAGSGERAA